MRVIVVSCILLATCSLSFATEYVEDVAGSGNPRKDKRFIFQQKTVQFQKLLRGLTAFSSINNNNNIPLPSPKTTAAPTTPAPTTTPTVKPTISAPTGKDVTLPIPDFPPKQQTSPSYDQTNFYGNLDLLTQYRDNAYALPENTQQSHSTIDRLPPLTASFPNLNTASVSLEKNLAYSQQSLPFALPGVYKQTKSLLLPLQQYSAPLTAAGLNAALQPSLPTQIPVSDVTLSTLLPQRYYQTYLTPQTSYSSQTSQLAYPVQNQQTAYIAPPKISTTYLSSENLQTYTQKQPSYLQSSYLQTESHSSQDKSTYSETQSSYLQAPEISYLPPEQTKQSVQIQPQEPAYLGLTLQPYNNYESYSDSRSYSENRQPSSPKSYQNNKDSKPCPCEVSADNSGYNY